MADPIGAPTLSRSGTLAAGASSGGYPIWYPFNLLISGTWTGSWWVDVSDDNAAWFTATAGGAPATFSGNGFFVVPNVFQKGLLYRITRSTGTGTMAYKLQGQAPS